MTNIKFYTDLKIRDKENNNNSSFLNKLKYWMGNSESPILKRKIFEKIKKWFIVYRKTKEYISKYNYANFKGKDNKKSKRMII